MLSDIDVPEITGFRAYNNNIKLKAANVQIQWTQEMIEEFIRCSRDPVYFTETYIKIVTEKGVVPFIMRDYQKEMLRDYCFDRYSISLLSRQAGKALSLDTKILTEFGFKEMKDIHPGDRIYTPTGSLTEVLFESEIFHGHRCFDIKFDNGEIVKADANHIWNVEYNKKKVNVTTLELIDILSKQKKLDQSVRIKCPEPLQFENKKTEINPYILGLWLGDGTSANGYITCHEEDLDFYKNFFIIKSVYQDKRNNKVKQVNIDGLYHELNKMGLLKNKHIPNNYIFNSIENRLELIRGLMDSDGSISRSGSYEFYQKNKNILSSVRFILSTLGVKSRIREKFINGEIYYTLSFCNRKFDFFKLPRKLSKVEERKKGDHQKNYHFYIKEIEEINSVPTKCIKVADESSLFLCSETLIPTHNTETVRAFVIWYTIFNNHKTVAILANKEDTSKEILGKIQSIYEQLPMWLKQGVVEWNKKSIVFENGSRVIASSTSSSAVRGYTIHALIIDEAAFIDNWDAFYSSVYPTISEGKETKLVLISTPNGLNHFYRFYTDATNGRNSFKSHFVPWNRVPGRDENWRRITLEGMGGVEERFAAEMECEFLGSSGTLISSRHLKEMTILNPIQHDTFINLYEKPIENHKYILIADVSHGKGLDYSTFNVIDVTSAPYKPVCVYRNNQVTPADFAEPIHYMSKFYNDCHILIEANDLGGEVALMLIHTYENENLLYTVGKGAKGKQITFINSKNADKGLRMNTQVKAVGCHMLKLLIEQKTLKVNDSNTIDELCRFSKKRNSYEAESGHDDLVMNLVSFGWLTTTSYFKEYTDINTVKNIRDRSEEEIFNSMLSFGYTDHLPNDEQNYIIDDFYSLGDGIDLQDWKDLLR